MANELRKTGISVVGDMPWGTHFCCFYETTQDPLDILIPYFKAGLENHEFCLCIASEPVIAEDAERALREAVPNFQRYLAEDRLQLVIDTIPAMVFTALPHGSVDFVNQRWLQYLGLSLRDVQGWNWDVTIHPEDRARSVDHWRSTMAAGQSAENELRVRRARAGGAAVRAGRGNHRLPHRPRSADQRRPPCWRE